jgi:hypothetical protein
MREGTGGAVNKDLITAELRYLASTPGVRLCALVDIQTGMVWLAEGRKEGMDGVLEAARDYWRVHQRLGASFEALGAAHAITVRHESAVLNLLPCEPGLVLVTLAEPGRIGLRGWADRLILLRSQVKALLR